MPTDGLVDFDTFVEVVDACRLEFVAQPGPKILHGSLEGTRLQQLYPD